METVHQTLYEVIGVSRNAPREEIEAACIRLGDKYRPDLNPGDPVATKAFADIELAYATLTDPFKRPRYDAELIAANVAYETSFKAEPRHTPNSRSRNDGVRSLIGSRSSSSDATQNTDSEGIRITVGTKQVLGVIGSIVLFMGAFVPLVSMPFLGSINYVHNGRGDGILIVILATASLVLSAIKRFQLLWLTGLGSLGILIFTFVNIQMKISQVKADMEEKLSGNPFRGLADAAMSSVQLQWGWAMLLIGIGLVLSIAAIDKWKWQLPQGR